ncbi:MAG: acyltransferase family protein [Acidimicrobiales bacterium]|nr:acyltransferase family protein [Acidimicrobiales bacterium]
MTAPVRPRLGYIPTFDGMRGFWVVMGPLLYHARPSSIQGGPDIVPGGILSLDLFFVLSSYLIVTIALKEWDGTGEINLGAYAGRRIRRLFPALFLVLGFLSIYLAIVNDPEIIDRWTGAIVSALTYSANWHEIAADVSYFEQFGAPSPLKHVWSFAIEEQFYLFAPLFLIAGLRWGGRRGREILLGISVLGALASAWWMMRVHVEGEDPSRAYYGTDTRAQALFVGIAIALAVNLYGGVRTSTGTRTAAAMAYPATAIHLWAVLTVSERDAWLFENGGFLLIAAAAGLAMFGLSQDAPWSPLHRLFASPPFRYAGRISYGLYLYHWPIYLLVTPGRAGALFGTENITGYPLLAFHLTLTVLVSVASFHLIEQPFVKRTWPISRRALVSSAGAFAGATAVVVILGGLLFAHIRVPPEITERIVIVDTVTAAEPTDGLGAAPAESDLGAEIDDVPAPAEPETIRILVVGDSVMDQVGVALVDWTLENPDAGIVAFNEAHIGCGTIREGLKRVPEGLEGPVGDTCSDWADPVDPDVVTEYDVVSWPTILNEFQPHIVVTHISPWDVTDRLVPGLNDDQWTNVGEPVFDDYARAEFQEAIDLLTSGGASLYILEGAPLNRELAAQNDPARIEALNDIVGGLADAAGDSVTMVDFPSWVGPIGSDQELSRRDDGVHISDSGLDEIIPWLFDQIGAKSS